MYNYKTGKVTTVRSDMPSDPNDPEVKKRKNKPSKASSLNMVSPLKPSRPRFIGDYGDNPPPWLRKPEKILREKIDTK